MALDNVVINDGQSTPVAHTFTYVGTVNNRVVRKDLAADPETPLVMTTAHTESRRAGRVVDSHLQRFDKTVLDADNVTGLPNNIRLMCDIDRAVFSDALADDFAAFIRNWATSANVRLWLRGAV